MVVFPVPGAPSTRNRCPREKPPDRILSSPQIPVFAFSAIDPTEFIRPPKVVQTDAASCGSPKMELFCGEPALRNLSSVERAEDAWRYSGGSRDSSYSFLKRDQFGGRHNLADAADALAAAPDFLPGFRLGALAGRICTETHFRRVGLRKIIGIHARRDDRRLQIIAMHAGEEIRIDDVFRGRGGDHLLVALHRIGLLGGDERRADIGK